MSTSITVGEVEAAPVCPLAAGEAAACATGDAAAAGCVACATGEPGRVTGEAPVGTIGERMTGGEIGVPAALPGGSRRKI